MSRLEKAPPPNGSQVSLVTSPEVVASLAEQITSKINLDPTPFSPETFTQALETFLQATYDRPGPGSIAFVDRRDRPGRPILDIYVLWSSPIRLSSDAQEMREITGDHAAFVRSIRPFHDSLLKIVDPRTYPSPEDLYESLSARWGESLAPGRVITCAKLQK